MSEGPIDVNDFERACKEKDKTKLVSMYSKEQLFEFFPMIVMAGFNCDVLKWFASTFSIVLDARYNCVVHNCAVLQRWDVVQMMLELGAHWKHAWKGYQMLYKYTQENFEIRDMILGYEIRQLECAKAVVAMLSLGKKRHVLYNDVAWLIAREIWKTRRRSDWHGDRFHSKKK